MEIARPLEDGRARALTPRAGRLWLTFGSAALLAGLGAVALVLRTESDTPKVADIVIVVPIGWAFVAAGLVAWTREPANRVGRLMVLAGFTWFLLALGTANTPLLFSLGLLLAPTTYAVLAHLFLAYPTGRLPSRVAVAVAALGYVDVLVLRIPWVLFQETPNSDCVGCPENSFMISDRPDLANAFDAITSLIGIAVLAYVVVSFTRRWRSASPRGRRALAPVLLSGAAVFGALILLLVLDLIWDPATEVVSWTLFALLLTVPVAFLAGLVRTRLATAGASRFLVEAPSTATPEEAQEGLRRALGDPTLQLAYWLPERRAYVDTAGNQIDLPEDGSGRMATPITYDGHPVGALVHDESLRHEPELVEAVVAAARVTLERDRLAAELRARLDELQRERDFVATVVNSTPAFFCVLDLDGRIVRFNRSGELMTGFVDRGGVRGRLFWDVFVAPDDVELVRRRIERAAEEGGSTEVETEIVSASGERCVLAWSSVPIVDAQGAQRLLVTGVDVTERRRQALELERERDFGHAVTDATPSFLVVVDEEGRIAPGGMNVACEQALGRSEAQLLGERFVDVFVPPADRPRANEALASAAAGRPAGHEGPWRGRDGFDLWVAWSCRSLTAAGAAPRFLVCGTDLTERKRQEQELQQERDALNTIADTVPSLILVVDEAGHFSHEGLNVHAERTLGYSHADVDSRDFVELVVAPEDAAAAREHFARAVATREPAELDSTWVTRTWERRRVAWSARWLAPDEDGRRSWFLVCGNDITDRERHAQALQRERDFLSTVGDSVPTMLFIVDGQGRIAGREALNAPARRVLGFEQEAIAGRPVLDFLFGPESAAALRTGLARAAADGRSRERDAYWRTSSGETILVAWSLTRLGLTEDGATEVFLLAGTDIGERKRQEDELRASRARIVEAADAERRRLERNLHDGAQQRLVTLSLTLRLVEARLGDAAAAAELLRASRDELAQALDELRDLARGIHPAVLSDHGLLAALDALASRAPLPVMLERAVDARLPQPVEVAAYYVVSEALANVQKYSGATEVRIGIGREDGHAVVEVRDDGCGGADAAVGTGLRGLADRVEAMGGRLEVESPVGTGTTVRAHIPVSDTVTDP